MSPCPCVCHVGLWKSELSPEGQQGWLVSPVPLGVLSVLIGLVWFWERTQGTGSLGIAFLGWLQHLSGREVTASLNIKRWNKMPKMILTPLWSEPNQVPALGKGVESQIHLHIPGLCHGTWKGKEGILCLWTKSHQALMATAEKCFKGKSFTICHLPSMKKFWKNIWLNQ